MNFYKTVSSENGVEYYYIFDLYDIKIRTQFVR